MTNDPKLRHKEIERKRLIEYLSTPNDCDRDISRREMKGLRFLLGMTQNEFSEFAHLRLGTLRAWEAGKQNAPEHFFHLMKKLIVMKGVATEEEVMSVLNPDEFKRVFASQIEKEGVE